MEFQSDLQINAWQPGSELSLHEHVEVEQTFVLEGSLVDDEGSCFVGGVSSPKELLQLKKQGRLRNPRSVA